MEAGPIVREFREQAERLYGERLKKSILYGSHARGEATEDSDVDVAVVLEGEVSAGAEIDRLVDIITDLNLKYGVLLSVYPVSCDDYANTKSPLLLNIRREGVDV
jgi:predicted nucleotidyltransferase